MCCTVYILHKFSLWNEALHNNIFSEKIALRELTAVRSAVKRKTIYIKFYTGEISNMAVPIGLTDEGKIQKNRQRSSLLFGGTVFIQFLATLAVLH